MVNHFNPILFFIVHSFAHFEGGRCATSVQTGRIGYLTCYIYYCRVGFGRRGSPKVDIGMWLGVENYDPIPVDRPRLRHNTTAILGPTILVGRVALYCNFIVHSGWNGPLLWFGGYLLSRFFHLNNSFARRKSGKPSTGNWLGFQINVFFMYFILTTSIFGFSLVCISDLVHLI